MIIKKYISKIEKFKPNNKSKKRLHNIIDGINSLTQKRKLNLVFICNHNSRRSQFAQFWGEILAIHYNKRINIYSAGMIKTKVYFQVIESIKRIGFSVSKKKSSYQINYNNRKIKLSSKLLKEIENINFISIMTCSDADASCPITLRVSLNLKLYFQDPKIYDDTFNEEQKYDAICLKIASELNYIFKNLI